MEQSASVHAQSFLGTLDVEKEFRRACKSVADNIDKNPRIRTAAAETLRWLCESSIDRGTYDEYMKLHDPGTELGFGESPGVGLLLGACYAHGQNLLRNQATRKKLLKILEQPNKFARAMVEAREKLEPNFFGELILEAQRQRVQRPALAGSSVLDTSIADLKRILPTLPKAELESGPTTNLVVLIAIPAWLAIGALTIIGLVMIGFIVYAIVTI